MGRPRLQKQRRPAGTQPLAPRTFRVSDDLWDAARDRADQEGLTISHVLALLLQGYAEGEINPQRAQAELAS